MSAVNSDLDVYYEIFIVNKYEKNGYVYSSHSRTAGSGTKKCKVSDVTISGIQHESDAMIAAVYHLLCKKFL